MTLDDSNWDLIHVFLVVNRMQKYEAAAHHLRVNVSTIRRKIQKLEAIVGSTLFDNDGGTLTLMPYHRPLLEAAHTMEFASLSFAQTAATNLSTGKIRLSMIDILGQLLADAFCDFFLGHPEMHLDVTTESHFVDLHADKIDMAIRLARPTQGRHGLRKLGEVDFGIYGEASYIDQLDNDGSVKNILTLEPHFQHRDHDFTLADDHWFDGLPGRLRFTGRTDNYPMLRTMCQRGMGLAMLPRFMAEGDPRLTPYDMDRQVGTVPIWLLIRKDLAHAPKIRGFSDYLTGVFRRLEPVLSGRNPYCASCGRERPPACNARCLVHA